MSSAPGPHRPASPLPALLGGLLATLASTGCGDDTALIPIGDEVRLEFRVRDVATPCSQVPRVESLRATLTPISGSREPREIETQCASSAVYVPPDVVPGEYELVVRASGQVRGRFVPIYTARKQVRLPLETVPVMHMDPRIAFLDVRWGFEQGGSTVNCVDGVEAVHLELVGEDDRVYPFDFDCADGSASIRDPLFAESYRFVLQGRAADDTVLYSLVEERVLAPGSNLIEAVLEPVNRAVELDWEFEVGAFRTRACDDVGVSEIRLSARVEDELIELDPITCVQPRPVPLELELDVSGPIELELRASGDHEFYGHQMREGSELPQEWFSLLVAKGLATVSWRFEPGCVPESRQGLRISVRSGEASVWNANQVAADPESVQTDLLPYGEYTVRIELGNNPSCRAEGVRILDTPSDLWEPFVITSLR